jgi:hypothetical protein
MSKRGPRFSEREKLATLKEGEKNSVKAVCAKYGISDQSYRLWRYKVKGIQPRKPFSIKKKREILEVQTTRNKEACARQKMSEKSTSFSNLDRLTKGPNRIDSSSQSIRYGCWKKDCAFHCRVRTSRSVTAKEHAGQSLQLLDPADPFSGISSAGICFSPWFRCSGAHLRQDVLTRQTERQRSNRSRPKNQERP